MLANSAPSVADIAAVTDGNRNGYGFGDIWIVVLLLFLLSG